MLEGRESLEVFLRLLGVYAACLIGGFALKLLAKRLRPSAPADGARTASPKGPGIGRKFKVFFAFQILLLSLSFWWIPGLALFLLALLAISAYEVEALRKSAASRPAHPFPMGWAYGLLALFGISIASYLVSARALGLFDLPTAFDGLPFLAFLFLLVAVFDGYSQICGEILGGPKMVPRISPGKTWSGFAGGMAFCIAVACLGPYLFAPEVKRSAAWAVGAAVGGLAFAGDISASWVKRRIGVKDFSNLLGPQGGVLDRADSLLWLGPVLLIASVFLSRLIFQPSPF